jgi:murein DD-endopeptidase MepM/ murein hydrolase activator NlpD
MAHLPEPVDDLDASLPQSDPVVRAPKQIVVLPEPPSYARRTVASIAMVAALLGGSLGAAGLGIVYAMRLEPRARAPHRADAGRLAARPRGDGGVSGFVLESRDAGAEPLLPAGPWSGLTATQQRLGRGRTLPRVLRALGLDADLATRVIRALRPLVNMRALQPTDIVVAMRDPAAGGEIRRVEYRRSETQVWAVTIGPDHVCSGERIEVVKTTARLATGFVVGDALEATLERARLHPDIVPRLREVFAALDLGSQLRPGDVVRLIVEEERLNGTFFRYGRVEAIDYRGAMGRRRAFFQRLGARGGDFFDAQGMTRERGPLRAPLDAPRITSHFNPRRMHPVLHRVMPHLGTDFGAPAGAPVYAAAEGVVLSVTSDGPPGNLVRLSHPALGVETGYAHLSRFAPGIHAGQRVHVRQLVGYVGSTGRSTGPHLHFSLKRGGTFIDPLTMYGGRRSVPAALRAEFDQAVARLSAELDAIHLEGEGPAPPAAPEEPPLSGEVAPPADEAPSDQQGAPTE